MEKLFMNIDKTIKQRFKKAVKKQRSNLTRITTKLILDYLREQEKN
jgi:hypothetical protein